MTERTSSQQSLAALAACDQSYLYDANGVKKVNVGDALAPLADGGSGASTNPRLYTDAPAFAIPSGYTVAAVIERPEVGAKAVIYRNLATNETLVAFGGTDGLNAQDYVANTQSYGWSQWSALNAAVKGDEANNPGLLTKLAELRAETGTIHLVDKRGQARSWR